MQKPFVPTDSFRFNFDLSFAPLIAGLLIFFLICTLYLIYWLKGLFEGYLPTLSQIAMVYPNTLINAVTRSVFGFILGGSIILFSSYCQVWDLVTKTFSTLLNIAAIIVFFATALSGSVNEMDNRIVHAIFAVIAVLAIDYCLIASFIATKRTQTKCTFYYRITMLALIVILTILLFFSPLFNKSNLQTVNGVTSLLYFVSVCAYVVVWQYDLTNISIDFVIDDK